MRSGRNTVEMRKGAEAPTILVVEDEWLVRTVAADYLRDCGYRVVEAGNGDKAVTILRTDVHIDVVFTDVHMPGSVDGFGLARWVRRERPGLRVILTSGFTQTAHDAGVLFEDGPLVAKPYDYQEVEDRIRTLLPPASTFEANASSPRDS